MHQTLLIYIDESFNRARTAERLYTHMDTVNRRLARVDELLPKPFANHPTEVAAALTVLRIREGH